MDGQLIYRGINVQDLIGGFMTEGRFGYEETAYLLLFGTLPTQAQLYRLSGTFWPISAACPPTLPRI